MALLLNEAEVTMLLPMSLALEAVEDAFRWQGRGQAHEQAARSPPGAGRTPSRDAGRPARGPSWA